MSFWSSFKLAEKVTRESVIPTKDKAMRKFYLMDSDGMGGKFTDAFSKAAKVFKMRATPAKHGGKDGRKHYDIEKKDGKWTCSCPDYNYRQAASGGECKHIKAHKAGKKPWEMKKTAFWLGFYKAAGSDRKEVSTVGVFNAEGKILMGKRHDTGKWTNPGGHLDPNELPEKGALRETLEESGIELQDSQLTHLETRDVTTPKGELYKIHAFKATVPAGTSTSMKNDPDGEVHRWHWCAVPLSKDILENLHSPDNVLLQALGLQEKGADE
jgi:8-oxo-dGTP pyrophosphatase MutT (NUDIX family)